MGSPKIGGTRAIKVNPRQFKAREGRFMAISYQKPKQFALTNKSSWWTVEGRAEKIWKLPAGGNFWREEEEEEQNRVEQKEEKEKKK
ncbi:hypothetical protein SLEP1_g24588 [Rubroshorea leprosula]|uniref:Uncharacterized protein n=1 Tax=Rubroshorea leprosula TaxID=152421 RepID=A0AAV5JNG0_9ROSI|nr:hypothetical protein SLEP1_g24588 [Rubroshorea leprosula]